MQGLTGKTVGSLIILLQAHTMRQATFHTKEALEYGTSTFTFEPEGFHAYIRALEIVGGVSGPKKAGTKHLGVPVFGSVRDVRPLTLSTSFELRKHRP